MNSDEGRFRRAGAPRRSAPTPDRSRRTPQPEYHGSLVPPLPRNALRRPVLQPCEARPRSCVLGPRIGQRSEERRVGKSVDLGGRRIIKKKRKIVYIVGQ